MKNNRDTGSEMSNDKQVPSLETQRRFWNWHWEHWEERKIINDWTLKRGDAILEILDSLSLNQPEILDFGCGKGWFTEKLALVGKATGIDLSEEAIAMAKLRSPHATFIAGNVYDFPLQPEKYDVIVSQEVLTHVENPAAYLDRAAYLLKPGGYLILACANKFVMERLGNADWNVQPPEHISWYPSMKDLKELLRTKFRILRATTILPLGNGGVLRVINSYKFNRALELVIPRRFLDALKARAGFGYQLIVLAQKMGQSNR
jgi:2-polyprenyl-3-methyl-5-hydroxy-6-metoxy-1,4-benzoquinol methylase